jgi:hypothetical protein
VADLTAKGIERREGERKLRAGNLSLLELSETMAEENALDLNGLIQEVLALIARELSENRILLERELTKTFPYVLGDRLQLQQVLLNLFINGIEAMAAVTDRPRVLSVQSWVDESRNALVIVRDSGTGLGSDAMGFLLRSLQRNRTAWGWACRSAVRLLKPMVGGSGQPEILHTALCFASRSRQSARFLNDGRSRSARFRCRDDPSVRSSLNLLIGTVGLRVESFDSAATLLCRTLPDTAVASCWMSDYMD